jgi:hypothetical protein
MHKGGESGPVVVPGDVDESLLVSALRHESFEMPPQGKLPPAVIEDFEAWIRLGAPDPRDEPLPQPAASGVPTPESAEARSWWAYQPLKRPVPPTVQQDNWVTHPTDAFLLRRLEDAGLKPNSPADKGALLRRAYYDLIGLPPAPEDVDAFLADDAPDAFERVVDRLLDSPHYGEKWGRHWLDLVRYAETNGYERDGLKENVWRYRDYVIRSLNDDKPYDRFILEQLAGDELPEASAETLIATAFYRLGLWDDEPVDRQQAFYDGLDDVVSTIGQVFLGMTIGCARCHDHKLDPLPQRDYYRLLAFVHNLKDGNTQRVIASDAQQRAYRQRAESLKADLDRLTADVQRFEERVFATFSGPERDDARDAKVRALLIAQKAPGVLSAEELSEYERRRSELETIRRTRLPPLPSTLAVSERGAQPPPTWVLVRGSAHARGAAVEPGFPSVLSQFAGTAVALVPPDERPPGDSCGRRLTLARWIASPDNPLTARVMANRLWQHHFGRGIVATANDFGRAGMAPTHPELLDWLACELVDGGWRLKPLHRLLMTSSAYRMSSQPDEAGLAQDPQNRLWWRFDMRRLTAEEIRDSMLAVAGNLNQKMFGPSIHPPLPAEVLATASRPQAAWNTSPPAEAARRSIYIEVKRSLRHPLLAAFDAPDTDSSFAVRFSTTVPTQALLMLNSEFVGQQAALLADRVRREASESIEAQVQLAIRWTTGRKPPADEVADDARWIAALQAEQGLDPRAALMHYCLLLLNTNEFVYLD